MSERIYIVGGSKGGVGKSMVSLSLVDYLLQRDKKVLLVETDNSNPDVHKALQGVVESQIIDLDEASGWVSLVNVCDQKKGHVVVVNTAARNNRGVSKFGATLNDTLAELGRELMTFWVINRQRDSLELLADYQMAIQSTKLNVLMNGYFGDEAKFELYNSSKIKAAIENDLKGKSRLFPELADRVADDLYSKRLSIEAASKEMPIGNRAELGRWRRLVAALFDDLLSEPETVKARSARPKASEASAES
ncbi:protein mobD [Methylocystis iwaonis]|uniref:CobQ/CobB/MinD/ParA nucleotide binding domain-containing protein n=1 Tax=Methylocystis iwaonis TaxID=2885079 RepID=A0ABM8EE96_9HYPH|nr:protein mobD [Methylocystis iwaonis]BDV36350.1 hypothetical protein SS37A_38800 [Methylocystis iwaonis]